MSGYPNFGSNRRRPRTGQSSEKRREALRAGVRPSDGWGYPGPRREPDGALPTVNLYGDQPAGEGEA